MVPQGMQPGRNSAKPGGGAGSGNRAVSDGAGSGRKAKPSGSAQSRRSAGSGGKAGVGGSAQPRERAALPRVARPVRDPKVELVRLLGASRGGRAARRLSEASRAFAAERFEEARRLLVPVAREAPEVAEVRELYGLVLYRLGRFNQALRELEAFRVLSGSVEQHPVLADCHRALHRWADVEELWRELGAVSPSADLVTEGRIVLAGSIADRGDLAAAVRTLETGWKLPSRPRTHHLRRAYALADLYERAGRSPRARELFGWVAGHDPDLADVSDRLRALAG